MSDTPSDLEPEPLDAEFEPAADLDTSDDARPHGPGIAALVSVFVFASLAGGALGFAGARIFPGDIETTDPGAADERAALVQHITGLETRLDDLENADPAADARQAIAGDVAALSARIEDLAARETEPAGSVDLSSFEARIDALETAAASPPITEPALAFDASPLEARLTALEAAQQTASSDLFALSELAQQQAEQTPVDPQTLLDLTDRITALELAVSEARSDEEAEPEQDGVSDRLNSLAAEVAEIRAMAEGAQANAQNAQSIAGDAAETAAASVEAANSQTDRQLAAQALALTALRDRAATGEAFEAERAALARLWRGDSPVEGLAEHARAGVRSVRQLAETYPGEAIRAAGSTATRLWGLIELQRVGPESDETGALALTALSEERLAEGDLVTAITVTERLEGDALDAARDWLVQARARQSVDDHIEALRAQLTRIAAERGADPS